MSDNTVGIAWQVNVETGWGVYGLNLALEMARDGRFRPVFLVEPDVQRFDPELATRLAPMIEQGKPYWEEVFVPFPVFHCMANDFREYRYLEGRLNAGFFFFESAHFTQFGYTRARRMDVLVAGSAWNLGLVSRPDLPPAILSLQGINPAFFHPAPATRRFPGRFVVFSGGKLEYRKGQDLVVAAFREFRKKHNEALLLLNWHNFWPQVPPTICESGLVQGVPARKPDRRLNFRDWLLQNGLPEDSFFDIGCVPNSRMPEFLRQADVGLFPNRCEGGTNLVAMETMACGVPCVLSNNTGHKDIISDDCLVLERQAPCKPMPAFPGTADWGESSVEEILERLEEAYRSREKLAGMGAQAAARMRNLAWPHHIQTLLDKLDLNNRKRFTIRPPKGDPNAAQEALQAALPYHQAGDLSQAEDLYRLALAHDPRNPYALHLLGVIAHQLGNHRSAAALIREALRIMPSAADFHNNLGEAYRALKAFDDALRCYDRALALRPGFAEAHANRGNAFFESKRLDEAIQAYRAAIRLKEPMPAAHHNLGCALRERGRLDEALAALTRAIELRASYASAWFNLGNTFRDKGRLDEAVAAFRRAIEHKADFGEAYANLGSALREKGMLDDALSAFREAVRLQPELADGYAGLAGALAVAGRYDEALAACEKALAGKSDLAAARLTKAMLLLLKGRFAEGWAEYEWRWKWEASGQPRRTFTQAPWQGEDPAGRRILVHAEQGFGDMIQFIRYAPLTARRGAKVLVECPPPLESLLRSLDGIEGVVAAGSPLPDFDLHVSLLSLPRIFQTTIETIPAQVPYLKADPRAVEHWRQRMRARRGRLNVGLAWAGNPRHQEDRARSIPLALLAPLAQTPNVALWSLQKGAGAEEAEALRTRMNLLDLTQELRDFGDTAALLANLDLVISADTAVAHLAGAMARPVWTLLPFVPDWRWLLEREDSPWYPTMRLFRQRAQGNWDEVIRRVVVELSMKADRFRRNAK